jgi:hypothetical protein
VAWFPAVPGRQAGQEQVPVALLAGLGGLGGPDGVQDGQVIGVRQGAVPVLGGGHELAVSFQDGGEHGQRFAGRGGWGGGGGGACSRPGSTTKCCAASSRRRTGGPRFRSPTPPTLTS